MICQKCAKRADRDGGCSKPGKCERSYGERGCDCRHRPADVPPR